MKDIKVLGTGCANCRATVQRIEEAARAKGVEIHAHQGRGHASIVGYGVMATPGVVVDGKVVHAGGVPRKEVIETWLA